MTGVVRSKTRRNYRPEPARWWIRHVPTPWPGAKGLWTDLAECSLGKPGPLEERGEPGTTIAAALPGIEQASVSDVTYLPPVAAEHEAASAALAERLRSASVPVLRQRQPDAPGGHEEGDVLDLLATLLEGGVGALDGLMTECRSAAWPLIPGLTARPEIWQTGLDQLAAGGLRVAVPQVIELGPAERRRLAEFTDDDSYQALFHGSPPDERAFCRAATARGLATTPERPGVAATPRADFCRRAATELILVAELWLKLERSEVAGQNLLRAARWAEEFEHDLRAVAREGNLTVLPWLDANGIVVVSDLAADGACSLRRELELEYSGAV